jgi:hypothetical protein
MSGPRLPSAGRAENANQRPSGEYAADSPTTMTSAAIAIGPVPAEGLGDGSTTELADGSAEGVGCAVGVGSGEAGGADDSVGPGDSIGDGLGDGDDGACDGETDGEAVGSRDGRTVGSGPGAATT